MPTGRAASLRTGLEQAAHLLTPTDPAHAVVDVLHSRIQQEPGWDIQVGATRDGLPWSGLVTRWPLPDLPDPAVRRVLTGVGGALSGCAWVPRSNGLAWAGVKGVYLFDLRVGTAR